MRKSTPLQLLGGLLLVASLLGSPVHGAVVTNQTTALYQPIDIRLASSKLYANPFRDVDVWAQIEGPSGQQIKAPGFFDGGSNFVLRIRFDEPGTWRITSGATPVDQDLEAKFTVVVQKSDARGPVRIIQMIDTNNPVRGKPLSFTRLAFANGTPLFHAGDTCYMLLALDFEKQVIPYLNLRAVQGFSHVRFQCARDYVEARGTQRWPWGGTPSNPDLDTFNLEYFRHMDDMMRELSKRGMGAEIILFNFYSWKGPMINPTLWTPERERAWVRYLTARYAADPAVYYWTLANEFETYPDGKYRLEPEDVSWAKRTATLVKSFDVYHHPVTVHPFMSYAEYIADFGRGPEMDLLMFQEHGREKKLATNEKVTDGDGEGLEDKVLAARALGKPVIVGEYGYEWDGNTKGGSNTTTDLLRRHTWRIVFGGGYFSSGFRSTVFNIPDVTFDPTNRGQAGADQVATLIHFFTRRTNFQQLFPNFGLVSGPNLCLRGKGELVVYAPLGGEVSVDLTSNRGEFTATWLNTISGEYRDVTAVKGGEKLTVTAPWKEAVLHLKAKKS